METHRTIKVEEFDPAHLQVMEVDLRESHHLLSSPDYLQVLEGVKSRSEQAVTFVYDGRILCCSGFQTLWKGVGECWTIPSVYLTRYPMVYGRLMRGYVDGIIEALRYHRLQTSCIDDAAHIKWMAFLGFEAGQVRRQFTTDKVDYREFARITSWE